jgi:competence protein CoiA
MRYALLGGDRAEASPRCRGTCPTCHGEVLAKCGRIVQWHWAHIADRDCDPWAEELTSWHLAWQDRVPSHAREVTLADHRADIFAADGTVIELQHSYLPPDEIDIRERFYRRMVWIFDATEAYSQGRLDLRERDGWVSFRWKHPRKSVALCRRPVLLDLGGSLLRLRRIHPEAPCGGWGYRVDVDDFVSWAVGLRRTVRSGA